MENKRERWELLQMQRLPLDIKIRKSEQRIREWVSYFGVDGVVVSFSGGKDSTVLLDLVRGLYPDVKAMFSDTGLEFPEIRDFVKTFPNVEWIKPNLTFKQVIEKCGYPVISKEQAEWIYRVRHGHSEKERMKNIYGVMPDGSKTKFCLSKKWRYVIDAPFEVGSGCCNEMKKKPLRKYCKETGRVPIIGTMAAESILRTQKWLQTGCNAFESKQPQSMPLSFWTDQDIWEYIRQKNLPHCSVYDMGYERTGCVFCMFGAHLEKYPNRFQRLKKTHPQLWSYCMKSTEEGGLGLQKVLEFLRVPYDDV